MMGELGKIMSYKIDNVSHVFKVWEDNTGTQNLANSKGPLMILRKKHIGIKYHWFRLMIGPKVEILRIATKEQRADIFTKGSTGLNFEQVRRCVMGW